MKTMINITTAFTLLLITAFFGCSSPVNTAGGTEGGNTEKVGIAGKAVYPDTEAAVAVSVKLRPASFTATPAILGKAAASVSDTVTDDSGVFHFSDIDSGSYVIEINDNNGYGAVARCTLHTTDTLIDLDIQKILQTAIINGRLPDSLTNSSSDYYVQIRGIDRVVPVEKGTGRFYFDDIPEGSFEFVVISDENPDNPSLVAQSSVAAGESIVLLAGWNHSQRLVLNTTQAGMTEDVYNFPLLLRLDTDNFDFSQAAIDGADLRFTKSDGTLLSYEIEQWDHTGKQAVIWVRMDTVYANTAEQTIVMHWGNETAPSLSNSETVFDTASGFSGVWHLGENESGTGTADLYIDATGNRFNGTDNVTASGKEGIIGSGQEFDPAANDHIFLEWNRNFISDASAVTLEAWVNVNSNDSAATIIAHSTDDTMQTTASFAYIQVHGFIRAGGRTSESDSSGEQWAVTNDTLIPGQWYHISAVINYEQDVISIFVNGEIKALETVDFASPVTAPGPSAASSIGSQDEPIEGYFDGALDEIRSQRVGRSQSWIRLCYLSQRPDQPLLVFR